MEPRELFIRPDESSEATSQLAELADRVGCLAARPGQRTVPFPWGVPR